ncbi:MAG: hypothetical protein M3R24_28765 [Chloroflexota bacterium]|nr:hypothetical protein [Chloroflexota bacterium]
MPLVTQPQLVSSTAAAGDSVEYEVLDRPMSLEQPIKRERIDETTQRRAATAQERRTAKPSARADHTGVYRKIGQTGAYLFTIGIAVAIWLLGAYFTVAYLESLGAQQRLNTLLTTLGMSPTQNMLYWSVRMVPVGLTLIEIFLAPKINWPWLKVPVMPSGRYQWAVFMTCLVPDTWTTAAGLFPALALALRRGDTDRVVWGAAVVFGLLIALVPERLARWSLIEIKNLWSTRPSIGTTLAPVAA